MWCGDKPRIMRIQMPRDCAKYRIYSCKEAALNSGNQNLTFFSHNECIVSVGNEETDTPWQLQKGRPSRWLQRSKLQGVKTPGGLQVKWKQKVWQYAYNYQKIDFLVLQRTDGCQKTCVHTRAKMGKVFVDQALQLMGLIWIDGFRIVDRDITVVRVEVERWCKGCMYSGSFPFRQTWRRILKGWVTQTQQAGY